MLPVGFSLGNLLLPLAATILTILFIVVLSKLSAPKTREKPTSIGALPVELEATHLEPLTPLQAKIDYAKKGCIHGFGCLRGLPKSTQVPEECYACERMVDCLLSKKPM